MGFLEIFKGNKDLDGSRSALPDASRPKAEEGTRAHERAVTEFQNPFMRSQCVSVTIFIYNQELFHESPRYAGQIDISAKVKFKNRSTSGEQELRADTFPALVEKINAFIKAMG